MLKYTVTVVATLIASNVYAQDDDIRTRALEACQNQHDAYTEVASCLPDATVAITALDYFDEAFSGEAATLKLKCLELNEDIKSAELCIRNALKQASDLLAMLPDGSQIKDPVFAAVAEPDKIEAYKNKVNEARSAFPDITFWGGGSYFPYK